MRFRKKPVEIEAWPVNGLLNDIDNHPGAVPAPVAVALEQRVLFPHHDHLAVITLEGTMRAGREDYLIRGLAGEFYPCKPDIFEATYDPVPSDA